MSTAAPLELHSEVVRPEWTDYNAHMNVAYYALTFDHACDAFLDYVGMDATYRARTGGSTFAVECHMTYQREVGEGDALRFSIQLLGYDEKRIHFFVRMFHAGDGFLAATTEWLGLHVHLPTRRVAAMPTEIASRLAEIYAVHRDLPPPPEAGRVIRAPSPE